VDITLQAVQRALDAFVPILVDNSHDLQHERRHRRNVQPPTILDHAVKDCPRWPLGARAYFILECNKGRVRELCLTETRDEVKSRSRKDQDGPVVRRIPAREGVGHRVRRSRLVLDREIKA
jgi:hypothetical protein